MRLIILSAIVTLACVMPVSAQHRISNAFHTYNRHHTMQFWTPLRQGHQTAQLVQRELNARSNPSYRVPIGPTYDDIRPMGMAYQHNYPDITTRQVLTFPSRTIIVQK